MIRHLFRIVWNRRRSNVLIAVEILLSFLVVATVVTLGVFLLDNYNYPLGFGYENVWSVRVSMHSADLDVKPTAQLPFEQTPAGQRARIATLLRLLRDMPEVDSASSALNAPYGSSSWTSNVEVGAKTFEFGANEADDAFAGTLELHLTRGRWFGAADNGAPSRPTVVNERLAREIFGDTDPIGRTIESNPPRDGSVPRLPPMRVIGVISDFRKDGELARVGNFAFYRNNLDESVTSSRVPRWLLVRAHPGAPAGFEERMARLLQQGGNDWSFRVEALSRARTRALRSYLPAVTASALVSVFLIVMVTMGLTGVLWQTVTQRTREMGLRRAKGATIRNVQRQVLGEVMVLTSLAVTVGLIVVIQFPLLHLLGGIGGGVYTVGLVISVACIYLLSIACAWAPSRLATSVAPAEALRYE
jgi:putative ABC transport system permease protein